MTMISSTSSSLAPRSLRAPLLMAVLLAVAAAHPAHAQWWGSDWGKGHGSKSGGAMKKGSGDGASSSTWGHHSSPSSAGGDDDDGDGDSGTWWKAKGWKKESWWSQHQDAAMKRKEERKASAAAWVPGSGIRVATCMLHKCGNQLRACRKDGMCRTAIQCSLGCGMGGDVASGFCAFQCALDNNSDATEAMFGCVIDNECMPMPTSK